MLMQGNASVSYDKNHDGKENEIAGCSVSHFYCFLDLLKSYCESRLIDMCNQKARGIRTSSVATKMRLTYFQEKSLKVDLQYKENEWTECFETGPLTLPSVSYLGFSAETGELSDNHDIISVQTSNKYINKGYTEQGSTTTDSSKGGRKGRQFNQQREGGSWKWFFFKVILFFGVVVGGYVGWTMYRANQRGRF